MKEQDAAHSFNETLNDIELKENFYAMEYAPFMMKVFEKFSLYEHHETKATGGTGAHSFTEGAWKAWFDEELDTYCVSSDKQTSPGVPELDIWIGRAETPLIVRKINAELIASLPELLAELTRLRSELQQERDKARNQAIQDCIDSIKQRCTDWEIITKPLEKLKQ